MCLIRELLMSPSLGSRRASRARACVWTDERAAAAGDTDAYFFGRVTRAGVAIVCLGMTAVIEIEGLRKEYRRWRRAPKVAVHGLDLSVPEGGVFGFLGPNGSGKTTTIRCLLGLVAASAGRTAILGQRTPAGLPAVMRRVGAIVETPAMFPTMTARENLTLLGAIDRIGPRRVDASLRTVGLEDRADEKVAKYSLGMRQRLGLAGALLKDPALLVLDEPVNGLDPAGIREIRQLLRALGAEGRTVFVSSHLLSEVEQTCDRVAIIDRGRLVLSGRVDEVLADAARPSLLIRLDDTVAAADVVRRAGIDVEAAGDLLRVALPATEAAHVTKLLADVGLYVSELRPDTVSLEELFLSITGRTARRGGSRLMRPSIVHLTFVEMRRALHRRLVRWMIALAVALSALAGVIVYVTSRDPVALARERTHPAHMASWWAGGGDDSLLLTAAMFLVVGAAICGASVAGAEWKAGTITTALTWEPARLRLHAARTASAAILAFAIGFALEVVYLAAAVPAWPSTATPKAPPVRGGADWCWR